MEMKFKEVELAEDLKEAIAMCSDIHLDKNLKDKIFQMDNGTLLLIEKEIDRGIIIHSAEEVTEELIAKSL